MSGSKSEAQAAERAAEMTTLSRRGLVTAGTAAAAAAALFAAGKARAEGEHDHMNHEGMDHSKMDHSKMEGGPKSSHLGLIESAIECVKRAKICQAHCTTLLSKGDTSIKDCYKTVSATIPLCEALVTFAAADAARLKDLAKLCIDVCQDCADECKKHAKHHNECKECEVACAECIKDCKELTRA